MVSKWKTKSKKKKKRFGLSDLIKSLKVKENRKKNGSCQQTADTFREKSFNALEGDFLLLRHYFCCIKHVVVNLNNANSFFYRSFMLDYKFQKKKFKKSWQQ